MKKVRKVLMPLFCVLMAVCLCVTASAAYTLTCWYAYHPNANTEYNQIGTWGANSTIKFAQKKLNKNSDFDFYACNLGAQNTWAPILGVTFQNVILMNDAQIKVYGGTQAEMQEIGLTVTEYAVGRTISDYGSSTTTSYGGKTKYVLGLNDGEIQIYDGLGRTPTQVQKTTTHEMGHALGWHGHSKVYGDLMYTSSETSNGMTSRDINHLKQVY